jgi:DUF1680 family protein
MRLYRVTGDDRYLNVAERMADFHEPFDTLPVDHTHGSISVHEALLMLYEDTGNAKYLKRVTDRWTEAVTGGYVSPAGGVLEKYYVTGWNRDEGCAEADWLRLNLMLWRDTGETRYLDMAERTLWSEYLANQWPDGGYGHRRIATDAQGAYAFQRPDQEALWCCVFHGPLGLLQLKSYLAAGTAEGIYYNFPVDFKAPVTVGKAAWTVSSKTLPPEDGAPVCCEVRLTGSGAVPLLLRVPAWADRVVVETGAGKPISTTREGNYLRLTPIASGATLKLAYQAQPYLEDRQGRRVPIPAILPATLDQVVLRQGPAVMINATSGQIQQVTLAIDSESKIEIPKDASATLVPWIKLPNPYDPHAFVFNVRLVRAE